MILNSVWLYNTEFYGILFNLTLAAEMWLDILHWKEKRRFRNE